MSGNGIIGLQSQQQALLTELFFAAAKIGIPDSSITVSECADKYRVLAPERSARPGPWSTDFVPYLREIMDCCSDPTIWKVVFVKPNQIAGTEVANNVILHRIYAKPSSIHYTAENEDKVKAWSTESLATMIRDTPVLKALSKDARTRDSGNTIKAKKFPGAHLSLGWATSAATGSSRPREVVICDEMDAYLPTPEGNYVDIVVLRTETFEDRLVFLLSTPRNRPEPPPGSPIDAPRFSPIEREYEDSDKRRYFLRCPRPRCHHYQHLRWEQVRWEGENPKEAWYLCEKNGCTIEEDFKPEMLTGGHWLAERPCEGIAGFHLNKLYSPFPNATWLHVVKLFLKAKRSGDKNELKVWVNTSKAQGWQDDDTKVETKTLRERRENYYGLVPRGVLLLTGGIDVQGNRIELAVWGWGLNNECWAIDHIIIEGDPLHAETWNRLKLELLRKFPYEDGGDLRIAISCIDTGFQPDHVRRFCRENRGLRIFAIKGSSSYTAPLISKPTLWGRPPVKLYSLGTNAAKDIIYAGLRVAEAGPGFVHFPIEEIRFDEAYFRQILSEHKIPVKSGRRIVRAYEPLKPGMRNEALDTWVYARCALAIINPNLLWLAGQFANRANNRQPTFKEPQINADETDLQEEPTQDGMSRGEEGGLAPAESEPAPATRRPIPFPIPPGWKRCDKPDCDRITRLGFDFCCQGCTLAAEGNYETHESGQLAHSYRCDEIHQQVSPSADSEPETRNSKPETRPRRRGRNFGTRF